MTEEFFHDQLKRLKAKWPKAFDPESVKLIASHCAMMTNDAFMGIVSAFIGGRHMNKPPTPDEFLTAARRDHQWRFNRSVASAELAACQWSDRPLPEVLSQTEDFKGCKTVNEAIEVARLRLRVKESE